MIQANRFAVETLSQMVLMVHEIQGQLSDGWWENATPHNHWQDWCRAEVIVEPGNPGRNFWAAKDNYGLTNRDFLDCVGGRMMGYVRVARVFGIESVKVLDTVITDEGKYSYPDLNRYSGEYWDRKRAELAQYDLTRVRATVEDEQLYTRKEFLADLRAIKRAMKTYNG